MKTVLDVLLTILKWIGIVLLWILKIIGWILLTVILLVILILSVPIRLHVKGHYRPDDILAEGRVSYLFRMVNARFFFRDNAFAFEVKLFGRTLMKSKPKQEESEEAEESKESEGSKESEDSKEAEASKEAEESKEADRSKEAEDSKEAEAPKESEDSKEAEKAAASLESKQAERTETAALPEKTTQEEAETADSSETEEVPDWAKDLMKPIGPGKIEQFWEKVGGLLAKVDEIWMLVKAYPDKRGLGRAVKRLFLHLGKFFHFQDSELFVLYGMSDPAQLGQTMGMIYTAMAALRWKKLALDIEPAFGEDRLEAEGELNLYLVIRTLIGALLGIVINRSVWKLLFYLLKLRRKGKKQK